MSLLEEITKLTKSYPRFDDGRIDYTSERVCPVVNCTVVCDDEVLLTYRSKDVIAYPETWNGISGFIDEIKPLEDIVRQELQEEVGIGVEDIKRILVREKIIQPDESINREWHMFPVLVELARKPIISVNWENKEAKWVPKSEVLSLKLMPGFAEAHQQAVQGDGNVLRRTVFGNPILRAKARRLSKAEVLSDEMQQLIADMKYTLEKKKYGIGLAAPQVGRSVALSVISIRPMPWRPECEPFDMVMVNPEIIETFGNRIGMWEGCISCGTGNSGLFAKVPRYKKLWLRWQDAHAKQHERLFEGLQAHVIQHETDHLNGVLFVDKVHDTKSYMTASEYRKRIVRPALRKRVKVKT